MKEVWKQDGLVEQFIHSQKPDPDKTYKWSRYVIPITIDNRLFLHNLFTKQCFEYNGQYQPDKQYQSTEISNNDDLKRLIEGYFLVPENREECSYYESILKLIRAISLKKKVESYTILPTTACNARCIYCYEEGMKIVSMTPEIVEKTIKFILATYDGSKKIHLAWFGGEPLLGEKTIDSITQALTNEGIDFHSTMITNGSLINERIVEKMRELWKLDRIQVSMDGNENDCIDRKRFYRYENEYQKILEAINLLSKAGIDVVIRCNTDFDNLTRMPWLMKDLLSVCETPKRVSFYYTPLYEVQDSDMNGELWSRCLEMQEQSVKQGFSSGNVTRLKSFRMNYCMAENPYSSVVIAPDGMLYNCEHCIPGKETGSVFAGIQQSDYLDSFKFPEKVREKCRDCSLLPECTPFTRCPIRIQDCYHAKQAQIIYDLKWNLKKYIEQEG